MDDTTTQLLTLLNVSALKRDRIGESLDPLGLNKKRKAVALVESAESPEVGLQPEQQVTQKEEKQGGEVHSDVLENELENEGAETDYQVHFGPTTTLLSEAARECVDSGKWKKAGSKRSHMGTVSLFIPENNEATLQQEAQASITAKLRSAYDARGAKLSATHNELRRDILNSLSRHRDLFITRSELDQQAIVRDAVTLHALNHIFNIRRRVLKNNDRLSRASQDPSTTPPSDVQDQGFTRPSVLILLPFRSSALRWAEAILAQLPSHQVEHRSRFMSEFSLPPGTVDKLAIADPGTYPADHIETFKGNVDDNFRVGIKLTKKSVKMFAEFYQCDLIVASPLGLRMTIEKEKSFDFLSSIEVLIVDQLDALAMQNWEHFQFVLERLNQLPKESHDADFSRIKPWYLDGLAGYLRQSVLLSPYETPEMRALFNRTLKNVAGKMRTERKWKPVVVPEGVEQKFERFECLSPKAEPDKRFEFFTTQVLPSILRSAVQSANTLIFIPSSFDFIRIQNHFRKTNERSFTILSEYSSNQDISRARQAFFSGKKHFLLMSERFHFFRRYRIRGIRNIVFYGLPEHSQFYTELLSFPFLDEDVEPSDVTCRVVYCKYDFMQLERIAGSEGVGSLIQTG